jgi:hypothetical protein
MLSELLKPQRPSAQKAVEELEDGEANDGEEVPGIVILDRILELSMLHTHQILIFLYFRRRDSSQTRCTDRRKARH